MSRCNRCNIEIQEDAVVCPLCKGALSDVTPEKMMYPQVIYKYVRMQLSLRIMTFLAVLLSLACIIINMRVAKDIPWSLVGVGTVLYIYGTIAVTSRPVFSHHKKIMLQGIWTMLLAVCADVSFGFYGWSMTIACPIVILVLNVLVLIFMAIHRRDWPSYVPLQLKIDVLTLVMALLFVCNIYDWSVMSIVAIGYTIVQTFGVFMIGGAGALTEIKRRFRA